MGLFDKWKPNRKEKPIDPIDLAAIGVDMHSHLLPGIDDGAVNLEDSIQLILHLKELLMVMQLLYQPFALELVVQVGF